MHSWHRPPWWVDNRTSCGVGHIPAIHPPAMCSPVPPSLDKWNQRRRGGILDHGEPDAAGAAAAYFDRSDNDGLVAVALASAAALFLDTTHIGLIHFDNA